jgi:hypothetical protein
MATLSDAQAASEHRPPEVDVRELRRLLDGRYAEVRDLVRTNLTECASVLEEAETMSRTEFRERVKDLLVTMASTGQTGTRRRHRCCHSPASRSCSTAGGWSTTGGTRRGTSRTRRRSRGCAARSPAPFPRLADPPAGHARGRRGDRDQPCAAAPGRRNLRRHLGQHRGRPVRRSHPSGAMRALHCRDHVVPTVQCSAKGSWIPDQPVGPSDASDDSGREPGVDRADHLDVRLGASDPSPGCNIT